MKPSQILELHRAEINEIIGQHHARNARVFGSVVHHEDTEESDLDVLVDPTSETTLLDIAKIKNRLEKLLGISIDVLTPKALPEKFRNKVLAETISI